MKSNHITRSVVSLLLAILVIIPAIQTSASASFGTDWSTWSQGGSELTYRSTKNDGSYAMRKYGCHLVAHCKLMAEAGIIDPATFTPDDYFQWMLSNDYIYGKQIDGTYAVGEKGSLGAGLIAYAKTKGVNVSRIATASLDGKTAAEKKALVQSYIENGYYVILDCAAHETYIMRNLSLSNGTPWISDSGSKNPSVSYASGIYAYTGQSGGGGGWEAGFTTAYVYSVGGSSSNSNNKPNPTVSVSTTTVDSITETSAVVRGSARASGTTITEVGMYLGTSKTNLTQLGNDRISKTSVTMYYSTVKYQRPLQPGTTYFYRAYAVAGGKTYWGETRTFTTSGSVATISLDKSRLTMRDDVCVQLTASTTPGGQAVTWSSSNPSVATVKDGLITGISAGNTIITAAISHDGKIHSARCEVTVTSDTGISLDRTSISIKDGESVQLNATTNPSGQKVTWQSSDTSVVVIGQKSGRLIGSNAGTATITAEMTYNNTTYQAMCQVTVTPSTENASISFSQKSITLEENTYTWLSYEKKPDNRSVSFTSSNPSVAIVDTSGRVEAVSAGTTTITASMEYNGTIYSTSCTVTVERPATATLIAPILTLSTYQMTEGESFTAYWTEAGKGASYYISYSGTVDPYEYDFGTWKNTESLSASGGNKWRAGVYVIQVIAQRDGKNVKSNEVTLTVLPAASENTRTGIVSGSNGNLAINDAPASSATGQSNMIGTIPEGATCTVYPDKQSGNWFWVTYNGVSGYAYGKYLILQ